MRAQGATEYLVLLAVVLIVALVAVALLGSQMGAISDTQATENQMMWKSQSPFSIDASAGYKYPYATKVLVPYIKIKNTGINPIKLESINSGSNSITTYYSFYSWGSVSLTNIVIGPGDSVCFGPSGSGCVGMFNLGSDCSGGGGGYASNCLPALTTNCMTGGLGYASGQISFAYDNVIGGNSVRQKSTEHELVMKCGGCADYNSGSLVSCGAS